MNFNSIKSVLIISYVFPPNAAVGVYRVMNLCNFFAERNVKVSVLTIKYPVCYAQDKNLVKQLHPNVKKFPVNAPALFSLSKNWKDKLITAFWNGLTLPLKKLKYILDPTYLWIVPAIIKGIRIIKKEKVDCIISSSPPPSVHIIGIWLKKLTGVNLIEDFRDLYATKATPEKSNDLVNRMKNKFESYMLKEANAVTVTSSYARNLLRKKYPSLNCHAIYNGYNNSDFDRINPRKFKKFTIIHVGSFYDGRTPEPLLKALHYLKTKSDQKKIMENLQCVFIGNKTDKYQKIIKEADEFVQIKNYEYMTHEEALNCLFGADIAYLVLDEDRPEVIPAKIFEYLKSHKPILAVLPEGEVAEIVKKAGYPVFSHEDSQKIAEYIIDVFQTQNKKNCLDLKDNDIVNRFERKKQFQQFINIFNQI